MATGPDGIDAVHRAEDTRRALLAKAGVVAAGGVGLAALARPDAALAATRDELKFEGYNNVKDHGAVGDGVADDTASIQDCIEVSAGNATVYFPPGTYKITAVLVMYDQTRMVGHGVLSVIKADPATTIPTLLNAQGNGASPNYDITVEDLTLDANNKSSAFAIKVAGPPTNPCRRIYLRRIEIKGLTRTTPTGTSPSFAMILNNIHVGSVEDCYIHDAQRDGINLSGGEDVVVSGNVVQDCGDDHIVAGGQNVLVVGNVCNADTTTRGAAIVVYGSATIVGNVTYGGVHAGIEVRGGVPAQNILIAGNAVLEAGNTDGSARPESPAWGVPKGSGICVLQGAIAPNGVERVSIRDNFVFAPRNHGVLIACTNTAPVRDVAISDNQIWMGAPTTVRQPDPTLAGCGVAVTGNTDATTPVGPVENVRVADNDIRRAKGAGIYVKGSNNKRWDIKDNSVLDSGDGNATNQPGILIDGFAGFMVNDNRSQDTRSSGKTQSHGLKVSNTSGNNMVTNNDFSGNASGAIDRLLVNATTHIFENLGDDLAAS